MRIPRPAALGLVGALLLAPRGLHAASCTWDNSSNDWSASTSHWSCGVIPGAADSVIINGGTVTLGTSHSVTDLTHTGGTIDGAGDLNVSGAFSWTAGAEAGSGTTTIGATSTLTINASGVSLQRTLTNNGTVTWVAGQIQFSNGGNIQNNAAFTAQPDNSIADFGSAGAFANNASGTFTRNTGTGQLFISVAFTNAGTVTVSTGELRIQSGSSTGTINGAASTTVSIVGNFSVTAGTFAAATLTLPSGTIDMTPATYSATTVNLSGATFNLNKASAASNWNHSSGVLAGSGAVTVASGKTYNWTGGTMAAAGTTTVAAGGTLTINASGIGLQRTLIDNGTITWTAGQIQLSNGGTLENNVVFLVQNDTSMADFGSAGGFNNNASGTVTRDTSSGTATISVPFHNVGTVNASSGTFTLNNFTQTAGQTILNGGDLGGNLTINGGILKGVGTINGNVTNAATVSPGASPGVISIVGNYTQTAAGTLAVEMNGTTPGTQYDQLSVAGQVTLAGTLSLTFGFTPVTSTPFQLITNDSTDPVIGNFAGLAEGAVLVTPNVNFRVTYQGGSGNDVVLTPLFQALYNTIQPCRIGDTRTTLAPALVAGTVRSFDIADKCGIPATAQAVSFNFTVVGPTGGGDLRIFPGDAALPTVSTINYRAGQVRANNAILLLGPSGDISVRVDQGGGIVHLIIDVNGYFE
jgi:hypothetical protein